MVRGRNDVMTDYDRCTQRITTHSSFKCGTERQRRCDALEIPTDTRDPEGERAKENASDEYQEEYEQKSRYDDSKSSWDVTGTGMLMVDVNTTERKVVGKVETLKREKGQKQKAETSKEKEKWMAGNSFHRRLNMFSQDETKRKWWKKKPKPC